MLCVYRDRNEYNRFSSGKLSTSGRLKAWRKEPPLMKRKNVESDIKSRRNRECLTSPPYTRIPLRIMNDSLDISLSTLVFPIALSMAYHTSPNYDPNERTRTRETTTLYPQTNPKPKPTFEDHLYHSAPIPRNSKVQMITIRPYSNISQPTYLP